jgi:hypothetical protein
MGCAYTGSAGGPIRTEIPTPIPICADEAVESDNTETVNIKTPNTSERKERFIFIYLLPFGLNILAQNQRPGLITFRPCKPRTFGHVAVWEESISNQQDGER